MFRIEVMRGDECVGATDAVGVDELPIIMGILSKPSVFGTREFHFVLRNIMPDEL